MVEKLQRTADTAIEDGLSDYYHRVTKGTELTTHDHGLIRSAFLFAFGCGMEFAIEELNRRTKDDNTKSGRPQG